MKTPNLQLNSEVEINSASLNEPVEKAPQFDLDAPELYLNREITWLNFNRRVLHEAEDERTPLLERVKFLAIVSSNLDEFFMKRIGGLKQLQAAGVGKPSVDGLSPSEQIARCHTAIREILAQMQRIYAELLIQLKPYGIQVLDYSELTDDQRSALRDYFIANVFPLLTPLAMDPGHPFPFISNLALNLLVTVRYPAGISPHMARVKVPNIKGLSPRLIRVGNDGHCFVTLDEMIAHNLDRLFPGMAIESCELFRVTRNANVEKNEEDADDLLEMIETEVKERNFAPIVRLEVMKGMDETHRGMLAAELELDQETDVFENEGMLAMCDLFELVALDIPELHDSPHHPVDNRRLAFDSRNIFHIIRTGGPILLQHPYESFATSVERFLRTASEDPKVLGIKMTLYRTSEGSVIGSLVNAARNGKQVAVLVELKARFDEAANIRWARRLEQEGIHVTYGVVGLKTHSKVVLIVRQDYNGLRRYAHIGTGNYHPGTARLYTDFGMLTCDEEICADLTELFNYLTGYSPPPAYRKILAAPSTLKRAILEKIDREIAHQTAGNSGRIQFKMNALEDADIAKALYRASQAGVKIDLIIRDTCRFRPGIIGQSESARVISIVGRFLEHGRIYYFRNNDSEEYYIGSADLMRRNLESRVEVVAPVEDSDLRQDLRMILDVQLSDQRAAWEMQPDGSYLQRQPVSENQSRSCQSSLIDLANAHLAAAERHDLKKIRRKLFNRINKRAQRAS
jgi:polyphosphate kinase